MHYFPPFHAAEHVFGEQYFFLSTPSIQPIEIEILDNYENLISVVNISNNAPQSILVGTNNASRVMTELPELGIPLHNKGYIFRSSFSFYCNYRVYAYPQSGSITCKGSRAIGRRFRPGHMINSNHFSNRNNSVSIFAVEETHVTVTGLPIDLVIYGVNNINGTVEFDLIKGETMILTAFYNIISPNNIQGFLGSLIESTGDIVVNCGSYTGGNITTLDYRDIGFDQIIPMTAAGNSFIAIRGNGFDLMENVIVVIDKDNTEVKVNGVNLGNYFAGEYLVLEEFLFTADDNMFIECTNPVVMYQMIGGFTNYATYGMNFIPALNCLGDTAVNNIPFYNMIGTFGYNGFIIIVARSGSEVRKNGVPLPAALSRPVQGNPDYVTYKLSDDFSSTHLSIESNKEVQVGLMGANGLVGFAAYFSGFGIQPKTGFLNLTKDEGICIDTLRSNGNYNSIEWYYNDSLIAVNVDSLIAMGSGDYYLVGYYDRCVEVQDTSFVYTLPEPDTVYVYEESCNPLDTGFFVFNDITAFDCDSVTIKTVDHLRSDTLFDQYYTCDINLAGRDTLFEVNSLGCDSLLITEHIYVGVDSFFMDENICDGESFTFEGMRFESAGMYCVNYPSYYSCDSVRCLRLDITPNYSAHIYDTICSYEKYYFEGDSLDQSGYYFAQYAGIEHCDSLISLDLIILDEPNFEITPADPYCLGDSTSVIVNHDGNTRVLWDDGLESSIRYFTSADNHAIQLITDHSCIYERSIDIPDPIEVELMLESMSDYNGFAVSCYGESDGWINVLAGGSEEPYVFEWLSDHSGNQIEELSAGNYQVIVSDENSCTDTLNIRLNEPSPLDFDIETLNIDCQYDFGEIIISDIRGSVPEYSYFFDGNPSDTAMLLLNPGEYEVMVVDANLCARIESVEIIDTHDSLYLNIIGPDSVALGNMAEFEFQSSSSLEEWNWSSNLIDDCENCWTYELNPFERGEIILEATDERGCKSWARHLFVLYYRQSVYIPNTFSPNGDGLNDMFVVHANPAVERVLSYKIFDRWGELIFENYNLEPNMPDGYWTGTFKDRDMNPAVFVYLVEVEYIDGRKEWLSGDVTLVR